jgi:hypothetical protein
MLFSGRFGIDDAPAPPAGPRFCYDLMPLARHLFMYDSEGLRRWNGGLSL